MPIPQDTRFDASYHLLKEGYCFISNSRERLKTDVFETRLLLQKTICMGGAEAAAIFYDNAHFIRHGAAPKRVQKTLTGSHGVQSLDGKAHLQRKAFFMALMGEESRQKLIEHVDAHWQEYAHLWQQKNRIVLFDEMSEILFRAACDWAGVFYLESGVKSCVSDLNAMVDGFGGIGPRYWQGRMARKRMENWARQHIRNAREANQADNPISPLELLAHHRENNGSLIDIHVAAVELLNLIRPIVAIATYTTFIAHALQTHPECRQKLQHIDNYATLFVQEVRRFYPFTPFVGARVRESFKWNGFLFPKGRRVILDIYGIDHDPRYWDKPARFMPERFHNRQEDPFTFVPQGGGNHYINHRCAGEWITIDVMKVLARHLAHLTYTMPAQNLSIDMGRIPTRPASGIIMEGIAIAEHPLHTQQAA